MRWEWESFSSLCTAPRDTGADEDGVDLYSVMKFYAETTGGRHIIFTSTGDGLADGIAGALVFDELPTHPEWIDGVD